LLQVIPTTIGYLSPSTSPCFIEMNRNYQDNLGTPSPSSAFSPPFLPSWGSAFPGRDSGNIQTGLISDHPDFLLTGFTLNLSNHSTL
jgi:hypothetical protein